METAKVNDLMAQPVIVAERHQTVEHVRGVLEANLFHALPVVNSDGEPIGVISSLDLARTGLKAGQPIGDLMSEKVYTVPRYENVAIAARVMRNHKLHHLVVTEEKKVRRHALVVRSHEARRGAPLGAEESADA